MPCEHKDFVASVDVNRIEPGDGDGGRLRFTVDLRVQCADCDLPFRFLGLPSGLDMNGAAVSINGEEACLAIAPRGEVISVIEGAAQGFTARVTGTEAERLNHLHLLVSQNQELRNAVAGLRDAVKLLEAKVRSQK